MKPLGRALLPGLLAATLAVNAAAAQQPEALSAGAGGAKSAAGDATAAIHLAEVYALARQRNPRLAAAGALTTATRAREASASLPPDPMLQLGVMNFSLPGFSTSMPTSMAPSVQLLQMVPFPGKLGLSGRIARQSTKITRSQASEAWWQVRAQAAAAFYELYGVDRQLEVMNGTLRLLQDFQQVAQAMYSAGQGHQADVLRAGVEVARMQADIAEEQAMRKVTAAKLNAVLDRPAGTPIPTPALDALPARWPAADTLAAWAEADNPMLAAGRTSVERAGTRLALARRQLWPDITVGVQYGQRPGDMGTERMGSAMVGVSLPIFAAKRQLRMREEAAAMQQMAAADLTGMRADVNAGIGELLAKLTRARTLLHLYRGDVLPQAAATVQSSLSSYRVGSVDFMTLVNAQLSQDKYEREYYGLLADYGTAVADLEMTIGRELPAAGNVVAEDR